MGRGCVGGGGGGGRLPAAIFALSQLYLSLSQLHLSFISVLSRRYPSIEIRLSPPHFALTHGYLTAISRLSHGYLPAIPSSAIPLWRWSGRSDRALALDVEMASPKVKPWVFLKQFLAQCNSFTSIAIISNPVPCSGVFVGARVPP